MEGPTSSYTAASQRSLQDFGIFRTQHSKFLHNEFKLRKGYRRPAVNFSGQWWS